MTRCQCGQFLALGDEEWIRGNDEGIGALLSDPSEGAIDFGHRTCIYSAQLSSVRACGCLRVFNLNCRIRKRGVHQHANDTCFGYQFEYQFQPLL